MVKPAVKLCLSGPGHGKGLEKAQEFLVIAESARKERFFHGQEVITLPKERCASPGLVSDYISENTAFSARKRLEISLHPSIWEKKDWGPVSLEKELKKCGFENISVLLDGSWEKERPWELLELIGKRPALFFAHNISTEKLLIPFWLGFMEILPFPSCLVKPGGTIVAENQAWKDLEALIGEEEAKGLLEKAGKLFPVSGHVVLKAGSRWFEFRKAGLYWQDTAWLWLAIPMPGGSFNKEKRDPSWLEKVVLTMGSWGTTMLGLASSICTLAKEKTGFDIALVYKQEPGEGKLVLISGNGCPQPLDHGLKEIPLSDGNALSWVAANGKPVICTRMFPTKGPGTEILKKLGLRISIVLPLSFQTHVLGVLLVGSRFYKPLPSGRAFEDLETMARFAGALMNMAEQQSLAESTASKWEKLFHAVDQPVLLFDSRMKILKGNPSAATASGRASPDELVGMNIFEFLYGREEPMKGCPILQVMKTGRSSSAFKTIPSLGGRVQITIHPLHGPGGVPVGGMLFARNVSKEAELESRFKGLVENADALFIVTSPMGKILFAAGVWESALGYTPEEVKGRNLGEFIHPHDRSRVVEALAGLGARPGKIKDFLFRARHKDGSIKWHKVTGYSEADEGDTPDRIYFFVSDVTDLMLEREEEDIKRSELKAQRDMLARFLASGTRLYHIGDVKEKLRLVCRTIREAGLYHRAIMGLLDKESGKFKVVASSGASAEELSLIEGMDLVLSRGGSYPDISRLQISNSYFIPREARLPGEGWSMDERPWEETDRWQPDDLLVVPMRNRDGVLVGALVVDDPPDGRRPNEGTVKALELLVQMAVSAIEHTLLKDEVDRRTKEWEAVFGQVEDMVAVVDGQGRVIRANNALCAFLKCDLEEIMGNPAPELLKRGATEGSNPLLDAILAGVPTSHTVNWKGKKLRVTVRPWNDLGLGREGRGAIWVGRISREKKERGRSRLETLGAMAGGIVHDFNNILCAIQGHISLMLMEAEKEGEKETLKQVERACQVASKMIGRLLDFSREKKPQKQLVDICESCRTSLEMLRHTIPAGISFDTGIPEKKIFVRAEPGAIEELVSNLAINARDAMPDGGVLKVEICEEAESQTVVLVVEDEGCGMERNIMDKIFKPWFTTKGETGGSGLGLATVKRMVSDIGGSIDVKSTPGKGTRFEIRLPFVRTGAEDKGRKPAKKVLPKGKGQVIMIVDDEEPVLNLVCEVFHFLNYRYLAASSSFEALRVFEKNKDQIECAILDLTMPGMGGMELAERFRKMKPGLPVILSSGLIPETYKENKEYGFLSKPFRIEDVANMLYSIFREEEEREASSP